MVTTGLLNGVARAAVPSDKIILLPSGGDTAEDAEISRWQERVKSPSSESFHYERLGWAFVAKARRTQDAGFYKLAEATASVMESRFGPSPDSLLLRGHVLHNLHRFAEAESLARTLVQQRGLAWDHALLSDCLMEQGRIDEAAAACQRAVDLRPSAESFARVAHLRWLKGDLPGAEEAMAAAMAAGSSTGPETWAWLAVRLSAYRLQAGDLAVALRLAERADALVSDYAPAKLAIGRALLALNRTTEAVASLSRAAELNPLPEYHWWLADACRAAGDEPRAVTIERTLTERGEASDPRTLSLFLATRGSDARRAVGLAEAETAARGDVFTHDAVAWARYAAGDIPGAVRALAPARAAGTRDARLLLHAGVIAAATGDTGEAKAHFEAARAAAGSLTPSERRLLAEHTQALASRSGATADPSPFLVGN